MVLRFIDGCDHYSTTAQALQKWDTVVIDSVQTAGGRYGGGALRVTTPTSHFFTKVVPVASTYVCGFAIKAANDATIGLLSFQDSTGVGHLAVRLSNIGALIVMRGTTASGTVLGTTVATVPANQYTYVEIKATISDTVGAVEIRLNGATVLNLTGIDTRNGGIAEIGRIVFAGSVGAGFSSSDTDLDDFYMLDTTGSTNNDFLGDVRVETIRPTGAGASTQFTPSTGANWAAVDDPTANSTDYVTSTADNQVDTYATGDSSAPAASPVYGVQLIVYAQKTDAGSKAIAGVVRSDGVDYPSSDQVLSTSFDFYTDIRETDPDTGVAWTVAGINAAEFGVKSRS